MVRERSDIIRDAAGFETPDIHSSSPEYASRFSGPVGKWFLKVQAQATGCLLKIRPQASALDVGGGHAQNLPLLVQNGFVVTVTGSNSHCSKLLGPYIEDGAARFRVAPLTQLPFSDKSFEIVLSYRILSHLKAWREHIAELCRVSQRSVLVEFPVKRGFNVLSGLLFEAKQGIEGNTRPYTLFREADIRAEFACHGFRPGGRRPQFFWPMALHRLHGSSMAGRLLEGIAMITGLTSLLGSPVIARFDREKT